MTCDECGKRATIRVVEMVDGELRVVHLCEDCAVIRQSGLTASSIAGPLVNLLMGLLEETAAPHEETAPGPSCPRCGLTYADFRRTGKLGCGTCYSAFTDELRPLLRRVHGSTQHVGTIPTHAPDDVETVREMRRLRLELERAVRREEYERAATLRDRLRSLEREGDADARASLSAGAARAEGTDVEL